MFRQSLLTAVFVFLGAATQVSSARSLLPQSAVICVPGTLGVTACTCGNLNGAGRGCANTGSTGAILTSAGSASLAANSTNPGSLTLTGTDMRSGSLCIFVQGDAVIQLGVTLGAGIRCIGGTLRQLYVKSLVSAGGTKTAPEATDLSISNQAAALGDVLVPSSTRLFQTYYRDPLLPNPGGSCPVLATFNLTQGLEVVWVP